MSRKTKPIWEILCLKNENEVKKIKLIFDQVRLKKNQDVIFKLILRNCSQELQNYRITEVQK